MSCDTFWAAMAFRTAIQPRFLYEHVGTHLARKNSREVNQGFSVGCAKRRLRSTIIEPTRETISRFQIAGRDLRKGEGHIIGGWITTMASGWRDRGIHISLATHVFEHHGCSILVPQAPALVV